MRPHRVRVGCYSLLVDEGSILLCRLGPDTTEPGKYTLPGGGMDAGELPRETAKRETLEETGLDVEVGDLLDTNSHFFDKGDHDVTSLQLVFRARVVGGELSPEVDNSTDHCEWVLLERVTLLPRVPLVDFALSLL